MTTPPLPPLPDHVGVDRYGDLRDLGVTVAVTDGAGRLDVDAALAVAG